MVSDEESGPKARARNREVYPSAALQLVAFEVRFPTVPEFGAADRMLAVFDKLREELPVLGPPPATTFSFTAGTTIGPNFAPALHQGLRALNRRRTLSATVSPTSLVVETASYKWFEDFQEVIKFALEALSSSAKVAGLERVGLRYVNEIRVPSIRKSSDWEGLIAPALLGPASLIRELESAVFQGSIEYTVSDLHRTTMRYGALAGWVVDPNGPIRVRDRGDGPFFLIDIDSYWSAPAQEVPRFSQQAVLDIVEQLHNPVHELFEHAITERLRSEVLREGAQDV